MKLLFILKSTAKRKIHYVTQNIVKSFSVICCQSSFCYLFCFLILSSYYATSTSNLMCLIIESKNLEVSCGWICGSTSRNSKLCAWYGGSNGVAWFLLLRKNVFKIHYKYEWVKQSKDQAKRSGKGQGICLAQDRSRFEPCHQLKCPEHHWVCPHPNWLKEKFDHFCSKEFW